ncbi:DUF4232 domain-containing protein [Kutzneria sp. CA-103260]|uniref:DUF4232 domain-containing protein n=1 Tax=Kutzneria sp. CA-103260 TaxID=2802641 RepID=UPI001BA68603|nr:DUF4232 domain-containing protein [Kutzneria sp. CA-103260]QUQ65528.1 hypothetical protein JJ691_32510 [Kutzneria sp. CA-103260]
MKLRHLFLLGTGVLLVGCSAPTPPPEPTTTTTTKPEPPHGPLISLGVTDAASGLRAVPIRLANCGSAPLTVTGYPALRVLDEDHKPIEVDVRDGADAVALVPNLEHPPTTVTLAPGQQAEATVLWKNTVTDATVVATSGTYFDVAPASGQPWQTRKPDGPIDLGNTGKVGVSPWAASPDKGNCQPPG